MDLRGILRKTGKIYKDSAHSEMLVIFYLDEMDQFRIKSCGKLPIIGNFNEKYKMGRNTSVSLGDYFENFVDGKVSEGRYKNASEVIRAGLRLLEEEESRIKSLKQAIQEGIDSGIDKSFQPKSHLKNLKAIQRKNG